MASHAIQAFTANTDAEDVLQSPLLHGSHSWAGGQASRAVSWLREQSRYDGVRVTPALFLGLLQNSRSNLSGLAGYGVLAMPLPCRVGPLR